MYSFPHKEYSKASPVGPSVSTIPGGDLDQKVRTPRLLIYQLKEDARTVRINKWKVAISLILASDRRKAHICFGF